MTRPDGSLSFRDAILFPQELADQLLAKMATEGKSGVKHATSDCSHVDDATNLDTN